MQVDVDTSADEEEPGWSVGSGQIATVVLEYERWRGGFVPFCEHVREHLHLPLGRTAIDTILRTHGLRRPSPRPGRSPNESALRGATYAVGVGGDGGAPKGKMEGVVDVVAEGGKGAVPALVLIEERGDLRLFCGDGGAARVDIKFCDWRERVVERFAAHPVFERGPGQADIVSQLLERHLGLVIDEVEHKEPIGTAVGAALSAARDGAGVVLEEGNELRGELVGAGSGGGEGGLPVGPTSGEALPESALERISPRPTYIERGECLGGARVWESNALEQRDGDE